MCEALMGQKCDALDAFPGVSAMYLGTGEEDRCEEGIKVDEKEELRMSRQLMRQRHLLTPRGLVAAYLATGFYI